MKDIFAEQMNKSKKSLKFQNKIFTKPKIRQDHTVSLLSQENRSREARVASRLDENE